MTRFLVTDAIRSSGLARIQSLNTLHGCFAVVAVLLFTSGYIFAADSPVIAPGAKIEVLGKAILTPMVPRQTATATCFSQIHLGIGS